jgi:hypothetical protein
VTTRLSAAAEIACPLGGDAVAFGLQVLVPGEHRAALLVGHVERLLPLGHQVLHVVRGLLGRRGSGLRVGERISGRVAGGVSALAGRLGGVRTDLGVHPGHRKGVDGAFLPGGNLVEVPDPGGVASAWAVAAPAARSLSLPDSACAGAAPSSTAARVKASTRRRESWFHG